MATMTPEQIQTELARKKSLGKLPTDPNNMTAYNAIPKPTGPQNSTPTSSTGTTTLNAPASAMTSNLPQQPKDPFAAYGGRSNYITNQNNRWNAAQSIKDFGTIAKLEADAKRVGYGFTSTADQQNAADYQNFKTKQNDWLTKMEGLQNTPFSYDPNTDPKFQAMQTLAKQRAGVASQSAMEDLNSRGILNSSVTASQLGQIQQDAEQEALSYIPQYEALARQDYRDRVADALNMYKTYADQEDTAYNRDYTTKRDERNDFVVDRDYDRGVMESDRGYNRDVEVQDRDFAYQKARDAILDKRYQAEFDYNVKQDGLEMALKKAMQAHQISVDNAQLAISRANSANSRANANADNARQTSNAEYNRLMDVWDRTGVAPAGLERYGIAKGTPIAAKGSASSAGIDDKSSADNFNLLYDDLQTPNLTKEQARQLLQANKGSLTDSDYKRLNDEINKMF